MKTIIIKGKSYTGVQGNMSDKAFESMLVRNDMTTEKMLAWVKHRGLKSC